MTQTAYLTEFSSFNIIY